MYSSNKLGIVEIVTHPWTKYSNSPFRFIPDRLPFLVKGEKNWMFYVLLTIFVLTQQGHCFCVREYHGGGILFKFWGLPRLIGRARKVDHVDIPKYSDHFLFCCSQRRDDQVRENWYSSETFFWKFYFNEIVDFIQIYFEQFNKVALEKCERNV